MRIILKFLLKVLMLVWILSVASGLFVAGMLMGGEHYYWAAASAGYTLLSIAGALTHEDLF